MAPQVSPELRWYARAYNEQGSYFCEEYAKTATAAREAAKKIAMPQSVRGLLCRTCNRGLGYIERFFDAAAHPENLLPVIEYLKSRLT